MEDFQKKTILVLSGGGIKGIAQLGTLKKLEEKNILSKITTFAGTSVGSIICLLLIIGYCVDELFDFVKDFDFEKLFPDKIKINKILDKFGIDSGNKLIIMLENFLVEKNFDKNITLKQLYEKTKKKFYINSSCVNDKKSIVFSYETHPNVPVLLTIRMSTSLPLYFVPVIYENKFYIDGSCICNILLEPFSNELNKVIGIYVESNYYSNDEINDFLSYISATFQCLMNGIITSSVSCLKDIIRIKLIDTNILSFNLNKEQKQNLFDIGYNSLSL